MNYDDGSKQKAMMPVEANPLLDKRMILINGSKDMKQEHAVT